MQGITGWNYHPYLPLDRLEERNLPTICRLEPGETTLTVEFFDLGAATADHAILLRQMNSDVELAPWEAIEITANPASYQGWTAVLTGLTTDTDYEIGICRREAPAVRSRIRLARTGFYPDRIVNYLHPQDKAYAFSGNYLCSPTFARTPSGALVTAMDVFGPGAPQNLVLLFRSEDNGVTWHYLCDLMPAYWPTLFVHRGVLYLLGTSTENGHLLIGASYDEGFTWTKPSLLFTAGSQPTACGFEKEPMPMLVQNGRLMCSALFGNWGHPKRFGLGTLSVAADADLLESANWTMSDLTYYNQDWPESPQGGTVSYLEGSLYVAADGKTVSLLRMNYGGHGKACLMEVDTTDPEAPPTFHSIVDMPTGANSKSYVLRDPVGGKYWALGNYVPDDTPTCIRNVLALSVSDDGYRWRLAKVVLDYRQADPQKIGFQYPTFLFDGEDILYISRTAYNGADNFHNANCQTIGRIESFRSLAE